MESIIGSQESPSRKTTATMFSPSPLIQNRTINPTFSGIESVETSITTPENRMPTAMSQNDEKTHNDVDEGDVIYSDISNPVLDDDEVETAVADDSDSDATANGQISDLNPDGEVCDVDDISHIFVDESCETSLMTSVKKSCSSTSSEAKYVDVKCYEISSTYDVVEVSLQSEQFESTQTLSEVDIVTSYLEQITERPFRSGWV